MTVTTVERDALSRATWAGDHRALVCTEHTTLLRHKPRFSYCPANGGHKADRATGEPVRRQS